MDVDRQPRLVPQSERNPESISEAKRKPAIKPQIFIAYGYAEGKASSVRFRRYFTKKGYGFIDDIKRADIIFAHSGGILFVDELQSHQKLIAFAPAYRDRYRTSVPRLIEMAKINLSKKSRARNPMIIRLYMLHMYYLVRHLPYNIVMGYKFKRRDCDPLLKSSRTTVASPTDDPWSKTLPKNLPHHTVTGLHDQCWITPELLDPWFSF